MGKTWGDRGEHLPPVGIAADHGVIRYCNRSGRLKQRVRKFPNTPHGREHLSGQVLAECPDGARIVVETSCTVDDGYLGMLAQGEHRVHRISKRESADFRKRTHADPKQEGKAAYLAHFAEERGRQLELLHAVRRVLGDEVDLEDVRQVTPEEREEAMSEMSGSSARILAKGSLGCLAAIWRGLLTLVASIVVGIVVYNYADGDYVTGALWGAITFVVGNSLVKGTAGEGAFETRKVARDMAFFLHRLKSRDGDETSVTLQVFRNRVRKRKEGRAK